MQHVKGSSRSSRKLSLLIATALVSGALYAPTGAWAQASANRDATYDFNIPAQSLAHSIAAVSAATGVQVLYTESEPLDIQAPALSGKMTIAQALDRLTGGTGVVWRFNSAGAITLERAPAGQVGSERILGTVRVEGSQTATTGTGIGGSPVNGLNGSTDVTATEGSKSYTTAAVSIGGKTPRNPKELQQSVTTVTSQRIQDQGITTTNEALNQATGITLYTTGAYNVVYSRGFPISSIQIDGGTPSATSYNYWQLPDLAAYDHVEVLRGADGLFSGSGEASGTVNLVRKRPLDHNQILVDAQGGSWNNYRAQIDVTGPIGWDGRLRARFVAAYQNRDFFYKVSHQDKTVLYGVVEADLTPRTLLTVGINYEKTNTIPNYFGLGRYATGQDLNLPRSTCLCASWGKWNFETPEFFGRLEQSLGSNWKLKINASHSIQTSQQEFLYVYNGVDPKTLTGPMFVAFNQGNPNIRTQTTLADVTLNGDLDVLGMRQELTVGGNWQRVTSPHNGTRTITPNNPTIDVFNFNPANYPEPATPLYLTAEGAHLGQEQKGLYLTWRSNFTDQLHTVAGVRWGDYSRQYIYINYNSSTGAVTRTRNQNYKNSNIITPYGGITYDVTKSISLYASYAKIFLPQGTYVTKDGESLKPITGQSVEAGVKGSWLDGRLNGSVAAYSIIRKNAAVQLAGVTGSFGSFSCCYLAGAEATSKGFDAELTGQILPKWEVSLGYTYNDNKYKLGYGTNNNAVYTPIQPRHLFKLWTMVQLSGNLSSLRLGGGVNAQSSTFVSGFTNTYDSTGTVVTGTAPYNFTQRGYAIFGLRGDYQIDKRWSIGINLNNLFDKKYYQTVGTVDDGNFYGEPRSFMVSLHGAF